MLEGPLEEWGGRKVLCLAFQGGAVQERAAVISTLRSTAGSVLGWVGCSWVELAFLAGASLCRETCMLDLPPKALCCRRDLVSAGAPHQGGCSFAAPARAKSCGSSHLLAHAERCRWFGCRPDQPQAARALAAQHQHVRLAQPECACSLAVQDLARLHAVLLHRPHLAMSRGVEVIAHFKVP